MQLREKELTAAEEKVAVLSGSREAKVDKSVSHFLPCKAIIKLTRIENIPLLWPFKGELQFISKYQQECM